MGASLRGDCRERMAELDEGSIDAIVTDPPYGLAFMGKEWDRADQAFHRAWATEALRVLKPGGHLLAFGGTRTYHRLTCGIEDAGFEVRDCLMWLYGSGFPKSQASLKPGWEPILLARKPGPGLLNVDACRIGLATKDSIFTKHPHTRGGFGHAGATVYGASKGAPVYDPTAGRWPANVVLTHGEGCQQVGTRKVATAGWNISAPKDRPKLGRSVYAQDAYSRAMVATGRQPYADPDGTETVPAWDCAEGCPVALLDQQSGECRSAGLYPTSYSNSAGYGGGVGRVQGPLYADQGGASRFFYTAKADASERVTVNGVSHPTVKPLALVRWLVRLVTPPGGTVLDPFAGSGTTGEAAILEGFDYLLVEEHEPYLPLIAKRIARASEQGHQEALAL